MNKYLRLIALSLILVMAVALLASCGKDGNKEADPVPNKDPDEAEEALEDEDYTVRRSTSSFGYSGLEDAIIAKKTLYYEDTDDEITEEIVILYFDTKDDAKNAYSDFKDLVQSLNEGRKTKLKYGREGKLLWYGTKKAIKAAQ